MITQFGILFKMKGNDVRSRAVALALKSDVVHCELIFTDGMKAASWHNYVGVGVFPQAIPVAPYQFVALPIKYEYKAREWFEKNIGASYNWVGVWGGMLNDLGITGKGYNCTDSCIYALKYAGMDLSTIPTPEIIKPEQLLKIIKEKYS